MQQLPGQKLEWAGERRVRQVGERMKAWRPVPVGANIFQLKIELQPDGNLKGLVSGLSIARPVAFSSLSRLILLLDSCMDTEPPALRRPSGPFLRANLELEILFRQNHSWQGKLRRLDTKQEYSFQSVLEMVLLIEALFA